jgi:hypothetical protein
VLNASVSSTATGGNGGQTFDKGGNGGSANAEAIGIALGQATVSAIAIGGNAAGFGQGFPGLAGSATLSSGGLGPAVFGSSSNGGTVTVSGTAIGGNGADSGDFGSSGASVSLVSNGGVNDAVGGATSGTLNLRQTAIGGNGGNADFAGGGGGNASSIYWD